MMTMDAGQLKYLATAFDEVQKHYRRMFRFDPNQRFSCYSVPLGELPANPSLGTPLPLMTQLYQGSLALVVYVLGPDRIPTDWLRGSPKLVPPASGSSEENGGNEPNP
jgi:hypothetical protein